MRSLIRLPLLAGLLISPCLYAQGVAAPPPPPPPGGPAFGSASAALVTESGRIRAFAAGPDGRVQSLYLSNGTVVAVAPELGEPFWLAVQKGAQVQVTGEKSVMHGQTTIVAQDLRVGTQMFRAAGPGSVTQDGRRAGLVAPPPPLPVPAAQGPGGPRTENAPPPPCGPNGIMAPPPGVPAGMMPPPPPALAPAAPAAPPIGTPAPQ